MSNLPMFCRLIRHKAGIRRPLDHREELSAASGQE
jgi:hypothetical protein